MSWLLKINHCLEDAYMVYSTNSEREIRNELTEKQMNKQLKSLGKTLEIYYWSSLKESSSWIWPCLQNHYALA